MLIVALWQIGFGPTPLLSDLRGNLYMLKFIVGLLLGASVLTAADRKKELADLQSILPPAGTQMTGRISARDKTWEDWVRRTGELPPDFDSMPSVPGLP